MYYVVDFFNKRIIDSAYSLQIKFGPVAAALMLVTFVFSQCVSLLLLSSSSLSSLASFLLGDRALAW